VPHREILFLQWLQLRIPKRCISFELHIQFVDNFIILILKKVTEQCLLYMAVYVI